MDNKEKNVNVNFRSVKFNLKNVKFDFLGHTSEHLEIKVVDNVIPTNISMTGFDLIFERRLDFSPNKLFSIKIEYLVNCLFDDNAVSFFNGDQAKIEDFIERSRIGIINALPIVSQSSLLVAELSNISNQKPLILPPVLKDPYKK
ncbi:hypothetical protein LJC17_02240 [Acholeplasma sp. OttesenSCG-928-E16]|nr:hypothetical protein [Acholeplasma sp. OttesenSCG-928-E16]